MADEQSPLEIEADKVPEVLPILPLYDAALFPKMVLPLVVLQGESVQLVDEAMAKDRIIGLMVSKKPEEKTKPGREDLAEVGDKVQEDALRAGYGPTIKAESVKRLLDSVINFQEKSLCHRSTLPCL